MNSIPFPIPPDWLSFLVLIGTPTFWPWFISEFVEKEQWFLTLTSQWKSRAVFIILFALSIVSQIGVAVAHRQAVTIDHIYLAASLAFIAYLSGNWYHNRNHDVTPYSSKERAATATTNRVKPADSQPLLSATPLAGSAG